MTTIRTIRVAAMVKLVDNRVAELRREIGEHDDDLQRAEEHIAEARRLIRRATGQVQGVAGEFRMVGAAMDGLRNIKRGMT